MEHLRASLSPPVAIGSHMPSVCHPAFVSDIPCILGTCWWSQLTLTPEVLQAQPTHLCTQHGRGIDTCQCSPGSHHLPSEQTREARAQHPHCRAHWHRAVVQGRGGQQAGELAGSWHPGGRGSHLHVMCKPENLKWWWRSEGTHHLGFWLSSSTSTPGKHHRISDILISSSEAASWH